MKKGWKATSLGTEIDLLAGFAFKSAQYTNNDDDIRLLRGDNIIQGCCRWDDVKRWPANDTEEYQRYQLEESDVVLAMDRPWVKSGLKHATISADDLPCLLVQRTARLRGGANLDNRFLKLLIGSAAFTSHILGVQTGIGVPHISGQQIKDFEFALPPLPEQQRIVGLLDEAFAGLATAKANAEKNLQNARALFESGLDSATTGKLTEEWRHKHTKTGNASTDLAGRLAVRRKQWTGTGKIQEPDTPVTLKPIDIPDGWVLASPEQITTHIVDCPHSTPKWAESGVVCLRTTNFKPGLLDLESVRFVSPQTYKERIVRLEPQAGDVLYSREGGILGIACMIPEKLKTCLGQRMMLFRTDTPLVLPEYFTAVLNSTLILSEVKRLTGGAASPHLNICDIRTFPIPLPSITEQRQIVAKLNTIATETQRLARLYDQKIAALEALKKSLLHQAFSGGL